MNVSRLREILDKLLAVEGDLNLNQLLNQLADDVQGIVNAPGQPAPQTEFAQHLNGLKENLRAAIRRFTPAEIEQMDEIGSRPWFAMDFSDEIDLVVRQNAVTPAVVHAFISDMRDRRAKYVSDISQLRDGLASVGINPPAPAPGTAEIGVTLPRSMFDNSFERFIKELGAFNFILRIISQAVTGTVEEVEVDQLSTTDPLIVLSAAPVVIAAMAKTVTWALDTLKKIEEIRKLRLENTKLQAELDAPSFKTIDAAYTKVIKETIEAAIQQKIVALMAAAPKPSPELENGLQAALSGLINKIQLGMTIEVRALPPPDMPETDVGSSNPLASAFGEIREASQRLIFPTTLNDPILLEAPELPPDASNEAPKPKRR